MPPLTIRHVTTYRYRKPVAFGEHRMMLRPRDSQDQRIIEAHLGITPQPSSLHFMQDDFGNHIAIARFAGQASELRFESVVSLDHCPAQAELDPQHHRHGFPVEYSSEEMPELAACLRRHHPDPTDEVARWARQFLRPGEPMGAVELLVRLTRGIHKGFRYQRREAKGIQSPVETLRLGQGSCRDFALLMIEAGRSLGLAARFASGYLALPFDPDEEPAQGAIVDHAHGATHAWAQIFLPAHGWIDFDPTSGSVGNSALVTVAVVHDPQDALPLHGTFIGSASDPLGMDVRVSVTSVPSPAFQEGAA